MFDGGKTAAAARPPRRGRQRSESHPQRRITASGSPDGSATAAGATAPTASVWRGVLAEGRGAKQRNDTEGRAVPLPYPT